MASKRDETPGPGAYSVESNEKRGLSRSVSAFLSREARFKEIKRDLSPGPAAYSVSKRLGDGVGIKLHPKLVMTNRTQNKEYRNASPGPGAYELTPRGLLKDFKPSS